MTHPTARTSEERIAAAFEDGLKTAFDADRTKIIAAYKQGRADVGAICGNPAAVGREGLAQQLANDPTITVDQAVSMLNIVGGSSGEPGQATTQDGMIDVSSAEFQKGVEAHVARMLGVKQK